MYGDIIKEHSSYIDCLLGINRLFNLSIKFFVYDKSTMRAYLSRQKNDKTTMKKPTFLNILASKKLEIENFLIKCCLKMQKYGWEVILLEISLKKIDFLQIFKNI